MVSSRLRGHPYEFDDEKSDWVLCETGESTQTAWFKTKCTKCGRVSTVEGHDACLGTLIGVEYACCGHGDTDSAYVKFYDGRVVRGKEAIILQGILKMERNRVEENSD